MIETSFYYSLLLASFFDVRRSDFWQLIVHHVVTIGLLSSSFTINFVRWAFPTPSTSSFKVHSPTYSVLVERIAWHCQ